MLCWAVKFLPRSSINPIVYYTIAIVPDSIYLLGSLAPSSTTGTPSSYIIVNSYVDILTQRGKQYIWVPSNVHKRDIWQNANASKSPWNYGSQARSVVWGAIMLIRISQR